MRDSPSFLDNPLNMTESLEQAIKLSIWYAQLNVSYLPVNNTHPYFGLHFEEKKREAENRGIGYEKTSWFGNTLKTTTPSSL